MVFSLSTLLVLLTSLSQHATAAVLTVGAPGSGCNHTTVQAAVNAANSSSGADEIRIARSATWTAQQISINTAEEVRLVGGYATCTSPTPDGTKTILSGAGGDARPVLTIRGNGFVFLRNLTLREGDQAGNDNGGGINFEGGGILDIADSAINENSANDGAGIYATGTTLAAQVVLGANVTVSSNIARNSGGGMVSKSIKTSISGPGTAMIFNEALGLNGGGYGGGLVVVSDQLRSVAYVTSNGIGGLGAIYVNEAKYGGGVAVLVGGGSEQNAEAWIYSTDPQQPVRIEGNQASVVGGGVYVREIDVGLATPIARLWRAAINDNTAPDGAAVYAEGTGFVNSLPIAGAASAPLGTPQNQIIGNFTGNTTGAILRMARAFPELDRVEIRGNEGGRLLYATDRPRSVIRNSLIADNNVAQELIRSADEDDGSVTMSHVTLTGNTVGAPHVLFVDHDFSFDRSLVAQPGKITLAASPGTPNIGYVLTNDAGLSGGVLLSNPRFIDPANGDYRLRAGSYAVDYAPSVGGADLEGRPHTTDMPFGGLFDRTADVGAYERPALQPLVLNSDLNTDLNLWSGLGDATWDGTTNASGPAGSGSMRVTPDSDPDNVGLPSALAGTALPSQCVHLPAPGRYRLNGWGKVSGTMFESNSARLRWELRYNGGDCAAGVYDLTNTHTLATTNTWRRPPVAAIIDIPPGTWTRNMSLTIKLETTGNQMPPVGWFDGITLEIEGSDTIFKNGFE
jgi:hypothetical protein